MDQNNLNGQVPQPEQPAHENQQGFQQQGHPTQVGYQQGYSAQPVYQQQGYPAQQGYNQSPYYAAQAPVYQQGVPQYQTTHPVVEECVGSAFGKALASVIICSLPIGSLIGIFLGNSGLNYAERANVLAAQYGCRAGGKNIAAKILGKIGKITSVVMTIFWGIYFFILFMAIMFSTL